MQQFLSACTELQGPSPISSPTREQGMPHTNVWPALQTNGKTAHEKRELQVGPRSHCTAALHCSLLQNPAPSAGANFCLQHIIDVLTEELEVSAKRILALEQELSVIPALRANIDRLLEERQEEVAWFQNQLSDDDTQKARLRAGMVDHRKALECENAALIAEREEELSWLQSQLQLPRAGRTPEMREAMMQQHKTLREALIKQFAQLRLQLEQRIEGLVQEVCTLKEAQALERAWLRSQVQHT